MKVLHLVDDEKFIDGVINTFRELDVDSRYVTLCEQHFRWKYIKQTDLVMQVVVGTAEYKALLKDDWPDFIWVHLLGPKKASFVIGKTSRAKVIWSSWGGDNYSCVPIPLFLRETFKQWLMAPYGGRLLGRIKVILRELRILQYIPILPHYLLCSKRTRLFLDRVSYYSTIVEGEEEMVRRIMVQNRAKCIKFVYTDLSRPVEHPDRCPMMHLSQGGGINVWVGNSATWTNNTFDALNKISGIQNVNNVFAPLSYGNAVQNIDEYGTKVLGHKWKPIKAFLPYEEYAKIIGSCQVFVFNHLRQQAVGNIMLALSTGGCVFLQRKNPVFDYLRVRGAKIYSVEELPKLPRILKDHGRFADSNRHVIYKMKLAERTVLVNTIKELEDSLTMSIATCHH